MAEVFTVYCETMNKLFGLWPCAFLTLPSYAFEANLFISGEKLPYIDDRSIYRAFEQAVRGGFAFVNHKVGKTTKPEYPGENTWKAFYTDATSLYSVAMLQKLPHSEFAYLTDSEIKNFDITGKTWDIDGEYGYMICSDIEYPEVKKNIYIILWIE